MSSHVAQGVACLITTGVAFIIAVAVLRWVLSLSTTQHQERSTNG